MPSNSEPVNKKRLFKRKQKEKRIIHSRPVKGIRMIYTLMIAAMILFLGKTLIFDSSKIRVNAYNPRLAAEEERYIRGSILDAEERSLAYTKLDEDGNKVRVYPYGPVAAHVTGYSARTKTQLELELNQDLLSSSSWEDELNYILDEEDIRGNDAVLTLDIDLQQRAYDLMGDYNGAVIISEVSTGKVLAMVSTPSFDPNTIVEDWEALSEDPDSPLFARATQGKYTPGSTFKIVTSLAAYRSKVKLKKYTYTCEGVTDLGETTLPCYAETVHGEEDITLAFANSCNTFYANLGLKVGADQIRKTADSLGLNEAIDFVLPTSVSSVKLSNQDSTEMVGETAIGQGQTEVTPLAMHLVSSAIAGEGIVYKPYLVDRIQTPEKKTIKQNLPVLYNQSLITAKEARFMEGLMEGVCEYGTASSLSGLSCKVYGKTGTAEVDDNDEKEAHSWFTGYTKVNGEPDIAITVVVENGAESHRAVPIVYDLLCTIYS